MTLTDNLDTRAETEKIGRLLATEPAALEFLLALPTTDVRRFRERCTAALYDSPPDMLDRIAGATKLVPAAVAAAISQKALGPRLAAAVAGRLDPARAANIIEKLPVAFTAESCGHLDPRAIQGIVDRLDEDLMVRIAVALAERGDHLTMGRFLGHLSEAVIGRILPHISDEAVLRTGYLTDKPERIDSLIELLPETRIAAIIRSAPEAQLWPEALAVARMTGEERRQNIASLTAAQDPGQLDSLVHTVQEQGLWQALLPLVALLGPEERRRVADLPALREEAVLSGAVRAVVATGLWAEFLPLTDALPADSRALVAAEAAKLSDAELDAMALEVDKQDLWEAVLPLVELMDDAAKERIFALPSFQEQSAP